MWWKWAIFFFPWLLSLPWHTLDSKLAHYDWSQKCVTTNLGDSQLAVWHGTHFWQLHCQLYTARNPCCTGLHLEFVLWLLRLCICAGEDLNQILTSVLCRFADNLVCKVHILLRRVQRGDLLQKGSWSLADWIKEHKVSRTLVKDVQQLKRTAPAQSALSSLAGH